MRADDAPSHNKFKNSSSPLRPIARVGAATVDVCIVQAERDGELHAAAEPPHVATSVCIMIAGLWTLMKAGLPLAARRFARGTDPFHKLRYGERFARDLLAPLRRIAGGEDHPDIIAEQIESSLHEVGEVP